MEHKDQLFSNMHTAALQRLQSKPAKDIACQANIALEGNCFSFESMGEVIRIHYPDFRISPMPDPWRALTILHYLANADGTKLSGKLTNFADQPDGMVRGGGFDRTVEQFLATNFGALPQEECTRRICKIGGKILSGKADLNAVFPYLPNYPVYLQLWFADEDFPASGRMLLDASASHYLSIEDAVTVGEYILGALGK